MKAMHTPGPWHTELRFPYVRIVAKDALCIAETGWWKASETAEMHANARLIAAVPELLQACEAVDADTEAQGVVKAETIEKLRLALAKARQE